MPPDLSPSLSPSPSPFAGGTSGATPFTPGHFIATLSPECPRSIVKSSPRPPPLLRGRGQGRGPLLSMSPSVLSSSRNSYDPKTNINFQFPRVFFYKIPFLYFFMDKSLIWRTLGHVKDIFWIWHFHNALKEVFWSKKI
jgi:hypothetical protein